MKTIATVAATFFAVALLAGCVSRGYIAASGAYQYRAPAVPQGAVIVACPAGQPRGTVCYVFPEARLADRVVGTREVQSGYKAPTVARSGCGKGFKAPPAPTQPGQGAVDAPAGHKRLTVACVPE